MTDAVPGVVNVPGRKSDRKDVARIADLLAHGLIARSFVPPAPIQTLRDLTRTRKCWRGNRHRQSETPDQGRMRAPTVGRRRGLNRNPPARAVPRRTSSVRTSDSLERIISVHENIRQYVDDAGDAIAGDV